MKEWRVYCVIDKYGYYLMPVDASVEIDEVTEKKTVTVEGHTMQDDESLVLVTDNCCIPTPYNCVNGVGFVHPRWAGETWTEGATPEEIAAWETAHPAPPPVPPSPTEILQEENKMLRAQITAESDRTDFIEDCIAEIAAQVYV